MYKIIADSSPFAEEPFDETEQIFGFIGKCVLLHFFIFVGFAQSKSRVTLRDREKNSIDMDFMPSLIVSFLSKKNDRPLLV